jgi:hypothetical protein
MLRLPERHVEHSEASCPQSAGNNIHTMKLVVAGKMLCYTLHDDRFPPTLMPSYPLTLPHSCARIRLRLSGFTPK